MTDSTYKINRFNMSLVNIVGITDINRLFFGGSIFIPGEKKKDYKLVFSRFGSYMTSINYLI